MTFDIAFTMPLVNNTASRKHSIHIILKRAGIIYMLLTTRAVSNCVLGHCNFNAILSFGLYIEAFIIQITV